MDLEIIFVSSDRNEAAFSDYLESMPWPALPFSERELKDQLGDFYEVNGIPCLVIVDAETGALCTKDGREGVSKGAAGLAGKYEVHQV